MKPRNTFCEQADGYYGSYNRWAKKKKIRKERRKAKRNPESFPTYGYYRGYVS